MKKTKLSIDYSFVKKGISLIVLVISIIIMIILAGVTMFILSETGVLEKAREASFKNSMKAYMESVSVYTSDKLLQEKTVNLDEINVAQVVNGENIELKKIIPNVKKEHIKYLSIEKGVLVFNIVDTTSKEDIKYGYWACQAKIKIKDFEECSDIYNIDKKPYYTGQYINGVCTPDLTGFNIAKTRYVSYTSLQEEIIGDTIDKAPPDNWYNYTEEGPNNKWANIVVENRGNIIYFVWIPRYEYAYNSSTKIMDVKYIPKETTVAREGYKIPEAFIWDMTDDDKNVVNLAGFWSSKYKVSANSSSNTDFTYIVSGNKIGEVDTIDIEVNTTTTGTLKYCYYIAKENEGFIKKHESNTFKYTFSSLKNGTTYNILVQVYTLDASGNITSLAGECQKTVRLNVPEKPSLMGFNTATTRYLSYDEFGKEIIGNNISGKAPTNWYDYSNNKWANIFVSNAYNASYFVWIPKYEYRAYLYNGALRMDLNFISATETTPTNGFKIPEAFSFDMTDDNKGIFNLAGFWSSKYKISENNKAYTDFKYKVYDSYIDITESNITKTISSGTLKYDFYIARKGENLEKKEENSTGIYTFSNLVQGNTYTVVITITNIDQAGNVIESFGSVEKEIYLYTPPKPILTGFNLDLTRYVTWDNEDTEVLGDYISNQPPANWYNYQTDNWANIKVTNGNNEAYFTWIPRYEYKAYYFNGALLVDTNFIPATKTLPTNGFKIPEAFIWDMTDDNKGIFNLAGFWSSKYKVSLNN